MSVDSLKTWLGRLTNTRNAVYFDSRFPAVVAAAEAGTVPELTAAALMAPVVAPEPMPAPRMPAAEPAAAALMAPVAQAIPVANPAQAFEPAPITALPPADSASQRPTREVSNAVLGLAEAVVATSNAIELATQLRAVAAAIQEAAAQTQFLAVAAKNAGEEATEQGIGMVLHEINRLAISAFNQAQHLNKALPVLIEQCQKGHDTVKRQITVLTRKPGHAAAAPRRTGRTGALPRPGTGNLDPRALHRAHR